MPDTEYGYALKQARKRYQDALAKGEYPYLPVLDNILADTDIVSTVSLGIMDIPLAKLVGTKTAEQLYAPSAGAVGVWVKMGRSL